MVHGQGIHNGPHDSHLANKVDPTVPNVHSSSTGPAPNTAGPHTHDILNRLDPRVNHKLDQRDPGTGAVHSGVGTVGGGAAAPMGAGVGHRTGAAGTRTGAGVGNRNAATGTVATDGPHHHGIANVLDPSVHSNASGNTGPAPTTAGPHRTDVMNKVDPTVDSDQSRLGHNRRNL